MNESDIDYIKIMKEYLRKKKFPDSYPKQAIVDIESLIEIIHKLNPDTVWEQCNNDLCDNFYKPKARNQKYCETPCARAQRQRRHYERKKQKGEDNDE